MSMERLNRAAEAAGFAMAAPDDEEVIVAVEQEQPSRALALVSPTAPRPPVDMITVATAWVRSVLPTAIGGRAPA